MYKCSNSSNVFKNHDNEFHICIPFTQKDIDHIVEETLCHSKASLELTGLTAI